jgi:hypothetical protein
LRDVENRPAESASRVGGEDESSPVAYGSSGSRKGGDTMGTARHCAEHARSHENEIESIRAKIETRERHGLE